MIQDKLHENPDNIECIEQERIVRGKVQRAKKCVQGMLQQQAKLKWLKCGDENTKIFYQAIKARRRQNRIHAIHNEQGEWVENHDKVSKAFLEYYKNLFTGKEQRQVVLSPLLARGKSITEEHKRILMCPVDKEDVRRVMFSIPDDKAPGADGFNSCFYKKCWEIVGDEVTEAILDFFKTGKLLKFCNRKATRACCMMKLDLKKAYDTLNWQFLQQMMEGVGFPDEFVHLIMTCVTTPRFSIMVNGALSDLFGAKRGLRQGDPMSPLLFALCMDYLARVIDYIGEQDGFKFHAKCKVMKLAHLCFADDLVLFCNGDFRSIYTLLQGVQMFSNVSALEVN
ncbi:uncharacterized protein LOC125492902 [Beta vulgaris subsp. vulgaris]|uniref:uncharacterized protein LOC125492902 n=1 Tax=Beta vulgaris subsp. vulgaris TaxID=3555 RepID=UPI00053F5BE6|nr:uncharacterized protein LOC125492902 [Beta vulgaris subsp. vulgaris]